MGVQPLVSKFVDDPEMRELLQSFGASLADTCDKLRAAVADGDVEVIRRIGHQLKGAGTGYGYPSVTDSGDQLEQTMDREQNVTHAVRTSAQRVIEVCQQVRAGLE
jgi:HPt (histidine-containing phosphotransfer) domain-containing protein